MKKRMILCVLTLCLMLACVLPAAATEVTEGAVVSREPGWCGENIQWSYDDGTLTISGKGEMDDFTDGTPWAEYQDEITKVILEGGVTYIGGGAFKNCDELESVDFGDALYEIGPEAFYSCDSLKAVYLPASFKIFGEGSFQSCRNLKEFHCEGKFPSFQQNCLWDTYATIYYPVERPWSLNNIAELEAAFKGRIEFLASDGTDHYVPEEPTEAEPVPETTAPTTAPKTQLETEPATEPVTEPETQPQQTEEPTEAATEAAAETESPAIPEEQEGMPGGLGLFAGLLIIVVVLTLVIVGALIFKGKKGRYSA